MLDLPGSWPRRLGGTVCLPCRSLNRGRRGQFRHAVDENEGEDDTRQDAGEKRDTQATDITLHAISRKAWFLGGEHVLVNSGGIFRRLRATTQAVDRQQNHPLNHSITSTSAQNGMART